MRMCDVVAMTAYGPTTEVEPELSECKIFDTLAHCQALRFPYLVFELAGARTDPATLHRRR